MNELLCPTSDMKSRAKIFPNLKSARNLPIANGLKTDLGERNWG